MGKAFFEVFPTLKLNSSIHDIMGQTDVEKVSATKRKDFLRIYLHSTRLILKEDIWKVEKEIKRQLFPKANITIKIYERFELSSQYNPQKLMDIYRDSILAELREYSRIEYNAFKGARIAFPDETKVELTVDDTVLNRSKEEELVRVLEKILVERCGFQVVIQVKYTEAKSGGFEEDEALEIQFKVAEIYDRVKGRSDGGKALARMKQSELRKRTMWKYRQAAQLLQVLHQDRQEQVTWSSLQKAETLPGQEAPAVCRARESFVEVEIPFAV